MTPTITAHHVTIARRVTVAFIAYVYVCAVLLGQCAYDLGRQTGDAIHWRNDQLAAMFATLTTGSTTVKPAAPLASPEISDTPTPAVATTTPTPTLTIAHTAPAIDYSTLTVKQLRTLTGKRSTKLRKADLVRIAEQQAA